MKMKEKMMSLVMFVATLALGIVDATGMLAAAIVPKAGSNAARANATTPKAGVGLMGGEHGNMTEGQIRHMATGGNIAGDNGDIGDYYDDSVDSEIVKFRPDLSPLDTITRQMKAKKAETMRFNWYSIDLLPHTTKLTQAVALGDTKITVEDVTCINPSDTIRVVDANGEYFLYVQAKDSQNNTLTVIVPHDSDLIAAPQTPAIANDAEVYVLGSAAAEGDMLTESYGVMPTKENNFCQIFKVQVSESTIQKLSRKDINWGLSDVEEQAIYQWRNKIEMSALFGQKGFFYDDVKHAEVYTTRGIVNYIPQDRIFTLGTRGAGGLTIENKDFVDLTKDIFIGNAGAQQRVMFAGSGFVAELSKIEAIQRQQDAGNTVVVWGIEWKEIRTNFGTLLLQHHKGFDLNGWTDKALVLDMQYVDKWTFQSLKRDAIDTKTPGIYDGETFVNTEICGFALRYPDCHAIVKLA